MTIDEIKQELKEGVIIELIPERIKGGQQAGMPIPKYRLTCDRLGIVVECGYFRQHYKNKELLSIMLDSAINEIIK